MLVPRRMGKGKRVLAPRSEEVRDASRITIPSGKSEWSFSPTEVIRFHGSWITASFQKAKLSLDTAWLNLVFQWGQALSSSVGQQQGKEQSLGKYCLLLTKLTDEKTFARTKAAASHSARHLVSNRKKSSPQSDLSRPIFSWSKSRCEPLHASFTPCTGRSQCLLAWYPA